MTDTKDVRSQLPWLKEAAEAATSGPWTALAPEPHHPQDSDHFVPGLAGFTLWSNLGTTSAKRVAWQDLFPETANNFEFMARCNPMTVVALITLIYELEQRVMDLQGRLDT